MLSPKTIATVVLSTLYLSVMYLGPQNDRPPMVNEYEDNPNTRVI
jgi:hypothetical protein